MEEKPPTERRGAPRARSAQPAFSAPEQDQPTEKPAAPAPRRAAKPAPAVTFQAPAAEDHPVGAPARAPEPANRPESRPEDAATKSEAKPGVAAKQPRPAPAPRAKQSAPKARAKQPEPAQEAGPAPAADAGSPGGPEVITPPAAKRTPAKKAAPVKKATPAKRPPRKVAPAKAVASIPEPDAAVPPTPEAAPAAEVVVPLPAGPAVADRVPSERTDVWAKLVAGPGHAPELLALAAVQTFGPRARDWAARTRESYPAASEGAVARLARQQFTRFGSLGSIFGAVAGAYAPITLVGTAAVTHAELVLHLAAAHGLDPADPERAVDLLVITRVHPTRAEAEAALAAARRPAYADGGLSDAVWRLGRMIAAQAGGWSALRLANRFFPGTSLVAAALTGTASAQTVAARAEAYYRASRASA